MKDWIKEEKRKAEHQKDQLDRLGAGADSNCVEAPIKLKLIAEITRLEADLEEREKSIDLQLRVNFEHCRQIEELQAENEKAEDLLRKISDRLWGWNVYSDLVDEISQFLKEKK